MKSVLKTLCLSVAAAALVATASALPITPSTGTLNTTRWQGNENNQSDINTAIAPFIGSSVEKYKNDVPSTESGVLAGSYASILNGDNSGGTITYTGGTAVSPTAFLLVKDGNQTPAWYLYNLTALGWNGTEQLVLSGFWPENGAISHWTLYGGPGTSVPDGGATVGLLGLGLVGIALLRRKLLAA